MRYTMGLALCLLFSGSALQADVTETKEFNFELQEGGRISLSNINGDVRIEGVAGNQVKIIAKKKAGNQEYLDGMIIDVEANENLIRIDTRHPDSDNHWFSWGKDGSGSVTYELTVPFGVELDSIETVNGDIDILAVKGSATAESVNGKISLQGLQGDGNLETVNGTIDAQFAVMGAGQRVSAEAVNGRIILRFPENSSAKIHAETVNGGIDADDFDLEPEKGFIGRELDGQVGDGEARVNLETVNGSITIQHSK